MELGVNLELSNSEMRGCLRRLDGAVTTSVRHALFNDARVRDLVEMGDCLVTRRKTAMGKSVKEKHVDDIICLVCSIKNCKPIERTMVKNGKRSIQELTSSRERMKEVDVVLPPPLQATRPGGAGRVTPSLVDASCVADDEDLLASRVDGPTTVVTVMDLAGNAGESDGARPAAAAMVGGDDVKLVNELDALKHDISSVKEALRVLKSGRDGPSSVKPCFIYVRLQVPFSPPPGRSGLEVIVGCEILQYALVRMEPTPAYKVKIGALSLSDALISARRQGCFADVWLSSTSFSPRNSMEGRGVVEGGGVLGEDCEVGSLKVASWNCRGLQGGVPYINKLIALGTDVVVVSEHWLWPYELHRLDEVHPNYVGLGKADRRLTPVSETGRGYGGVGLLWRKELIASGIDGIDCDRICGLRLNVRVEEVLSVIGVYLPCLELGIDYYRECLAVLEEVVSASMQLGPTIVAGDFNAHLGTLGGPRGLGNPNQQGVLLDLMLRRCDLYAASLAEYATGPSYTCKSGVTTSTIDYIFMDVGAASHLAGCATLSWDDLNTSDHLPQLASLKILAGRRGEIEAGDRVNWDKVASLGGEDLEEYRSEVSKGLAPFIGKKYDSVMCIEEDIVRVGATLCDAASATLPKVGGVRRRPLCDKELSEVTKRNKDAWFRWCEACRPTRGPAYELKNRLRREVRSCVHRCAGRAERKRVGRFERRFRERSHCRYRLPGGKKSRCSKLRVDGKLISDKDELLQAWVRHFSKLAESRIGSESGLRVLGDRVEEMVK